MLSLEGERRAPAKRRRGHHSRTSEDQACLDALAALLRADATSAERSLSRVSRAALAERLLPATKALIQAASLVLDETPAYGYAIELDLALSPACLMGMCTGSPPGNTWTSPCSSPTCQHSCHRGPRTQTYSAGIAGYPSRTGPM